MEANGESRAKSGIVRLPGTVSSGGIDSLLAPRSQEQQLRMTTAMNAYQHRYPTEIHARNERIRDRVPIVGEWIANKLHGRMIRSMAQQRATDSGSLLG